jgi:hypothetical protein
MTDGLQSELVWHRSSVCESGACVEVAATDDAVMVRSSGDPGASPVTVSHGKWHEFLARVRDGRSIARSPAKELLSNSSGQVRALKSDPQPRSSVGFE